jgi:hypothetical protein
MPLPKTTDVGKLIAFLKSEKPNMSKGQRLAIALDTARRSGTKIKKKKKK